MSNPGDRCARSDCDRTRENHINVDHVFVEPAPAEVLCEQHGRENCPRPDHTEAPQSCPARSGSGDVQAESAHPCQCDTFVEPSWCPTCLKERIYTASCEHMRPAPMAPCEGGCGKWTDTGIRCADCGGDTECEACRDDYSFQCDVCKAVFCGEHAAAHKHDTAPDPDAAVRAIAERWRQEWESDDLETIDEFFLRMTTEVHATGRALGRDEGARALQAFRDGLENENSEYGRGVRDCIDAITRLEKKAQPCGHEWPCLLEDCAVRSAEAARIADAATRAPEKGRR